MASFIELPRIDYRGGDAPSLYVNTDDIVAFQALYDGQTQVDIRDMGSEGMTARVATYLPLDSLLDVLGELAKYPGARSWTARTRDEWAAPHRANAEASFERERAAR